MYRFCRSSSSMLHVGVHMCQGVISNKHCFLLPLACAIWPYILYVHVHQEIDDRNPHRPTPTAVATLVLRWNSSFEAVVFCVQLPNVWPKFCNVFVWVYTNMLLLFSCNFLKIIVNKFSLKSEYLMNQSLFNCTGRHFIFSRQSATL